MDLSGTVIETTRLRLEPISPRYRDDIFCAFTESVAKYTYPQPTGDIADTDAFISSSFEETRDGGNLQFVAILRETGEFIGCTGLHKLKVCPEPGLWLKESAWNQGFGFEIVAALARWAEEHLDCESLYYPVEKDNIASRRIPEKLGGNLEGGVFAGENANGKKAEMVAYRIPLHRK